MPELEYLRRTHSAEDHEHSGCPCLTIAQYLKGRDLESDHKISVIDHVKSGQEESVSLAERPATELDSEQVSSLFDQDQITFLHRIQEDPDAVYTPQSALEGASISQLNTELFGDFKEVANKAITARRSSDRQRKRLASRGRRRVPDFLTQESRAVNLAALKRMSRSSSSSPRARLVVPEMSVESEDIEPPLPFEAELKLNPPPRRSCSSPFFGSSESELVGRRDGGIKDGQNLLKIIGICALAFALVTWTLLIASASIKQNLSDNQEGKPATQVEAAAPSSLYQREQMQEQMRQEQLLQQQYQQQQMQQQYQAAASARGYRTVNTSIYLPTPPAPVFATPAPTYTSETQSFLVDSKQDTSKDISSDTQQQGPNLFGWFLGLLFFGAAAWGIDFASRDDEVAAYVLSS